VSAANRRISADLTYTQSLRMDEHGSVFWLCETMVETGQVVAMVVKPWRQGVDYRVGSWCGILLTMRSLSRRSWPKVGLD
jgi:hypothetical protein